ncbi:MAG TPA: hypothetical protein VG520_03550 [Candidatus Dormibacteraeota bacterium]|nr:hypothetical protein [Candidatus Dormibacteraeota bacterium]
MSAGVLQAAGLIHHHRGRVNTLDRGGLEEVSCECCRVIREVFQRADIPAGT